MHLVHELMHEVGFGKIEIYVDYCDDKVQPFASSLAHAHVSHTHTHTYICIGAFCRFPPPPVETLPPLCMRARALSQRTYSHDMCVRITQGLYRHGKTPVSLQEWNESIQEEDWVSAYVVARK